MILVSAPSTCIDAYEASQGPSGEARSQGGVRPWVSLTTAQAEAACVAAGKHLCSEAEWTRACKGPSNNLTYPYGNTYSGTACNGADKGLGVIVNTGSIGTCVGGFSGIYDLSGNVYERTATCANGTCKLYGGSYRSGVGPGYLKCTGTFDFGEASPDDAVGFRCCL